MLDLNFEGNLPSCCSKVWTDDEQADGWTDDGWGDIIIADPEPSVQMS